jgi:hypothetical protein
MTKNVGNIDKAFRVILGIALLSLIFVGPKTLWGLVGLVPLATVVMSWCPVYSLFGVSTCPAAGPPKQF